MIGYTSVPSVNGQYPLSAQNTGNPPYAVGVSWLLAKKGMEFSRPISFDKWVEIGRQLSIVVTSSTWCLGDWLAYGESTFNGRYRDAVEVTALDYQTLRNYAWVARRFPMSRRRDTLSFTHHAEVAALPEPEQDFWLRKADEQGWPVKHLRRELKMSMQERASENEQEVDGLGCANDTVGRSREETFILQLSISADSLESCSSVASGLGLNVETWARQILIREAAREAVKKDSQAA